MERKFSFIIILFIYLHPRIIKLNLKIFIRPLHELFTFKRNDVLKTRLTGAPRAALHTALTDPFFYLHHPDLKIADIGKISNFIRERERKKLRIQASIGLKLLLK